MINSIVAGNWKMNTTQEEAIALAGDIKQNIELTVGTKTIICPPFISLTSIKDVLKGTNIGLGAQNMHFESKGAFTGETSPNMLATLCEYVILGHSERRQYFGEQDDTVNKKILAAQSIGLIPIMCVGENLQDRQDGQASQVVSSQIKNGLHSVTDSNNLIVAYEPIWAIGSGIAASGEIAEEMMGTIRQALSDLYGHEKAYDVPLLYGGSVNADNVHEFASQPNINGALVGGASLNPKAFAEIVEGFSITE